MSQNALGLLATDWPARGSLRPPPYCLRASEQGETANPMSVPEHMIPAEEEGTCTGLVPKPATKTLATLAVPQTAAPWCREPWPSQMSGSYQGHPHPEGLSRLQACLPAVSARMSYWLVFYLRQNPDINNRRKEGYFGFTVRGPTRLAARGRQLSHIVSEARKQKEINAGTQLTFSCLFSKSYQIDKDD